MKEFELNQKVELVAEDGKTSTGTIHDIKDDKIYISVTIGDLRRKILRPGDEIYGILYCQDKIMAFNGSISARIMDNIPLYEVTDISNLTKAQRRKYVRVPCSIAAKYSHNRYLLNLNIKDGKMQQDLDSLSRYLNDGIILDLGAGGVKIYISEDLEIGTEILLSFTLKDEMILKGILVYKEINMLPNKTTYLYGVKFSDINDKQREQIISYVFVLLRQNRVK